MLTAWKSFTHGLRRPWPLRLELRGHWEVFSDEQYAANKARMNAMKAQGYGSQGGSK